MYPGSIPTRRAGAKALKRINKVSDCESKARTLKRHLGSGLFLVLVLTESPYFITIDPKVPARLLLGPAVKNNVFLAPLLGVPPPKSIAQSWSI
jgi:hypothetical protein